MKNDYDSDDDILADDEQPGGLRWMTIAVVLLVVAGFFALAGYAYRNSAKPADGSVEIVHADATPVKEKPKDPGGMNIPYQDMSVYNVISEGGEKKDDKKVEKLMPEPEEPMANREAATSKTEKKEDTKVFIKGEPDEKDSPEARDKAKPESDAQNVPAPAASKTEPKTAFKEKPKIEIPDKALGITEPTQYMAKPAAAPTPPASTVPNAAASQTAALQLAPPAAVPVEAPAEAAPPVATGNVQVQLAALKSMEEAERTWKNLQGKFSTALSGKTHNVVKAELPSGTFYRLRVGGFSPDAAKKTCSDLAAKKQPCLIVR